MPWIFIACWVQLFSPPLARRLSPSVWPKRIKDSLLLQRIVPQVQGVRGSNTFLFFAHDKRSQAYRNRYRPLHTRTGLKEILLLIVLLTTVAVLCADFFGYGLDETACVAAR